MCVFYAHFTSPSLYEGDLSSGCYSAAPEDSPQPEPVRESLADSLDYELALGAEGGLWWKLECEAGRYYLVLYDTSTRAVPHIIATEEGLEEIYDFGDSSELASAFVDEITPAEMIEEGLTIVSDLGDDLPSVLHIRPRKNKPHIGAKSWEKNHGGEESFPEFLVRVITHGEEESYIEKDFSKRTVRHQQDSDEGWGIFESPLDPRPLYSSKYTEPGELVEQWAINALLGIVGEEEVQKVLCRRRPQRMISMPVCKAGLERLGVFEEVELGESPDTDSWESVPWHHLDDLGRETTWFQSVVLRKKVDVHDPIDWVLYPDLLTTWHGKTYRD